MTKIDLKRRAEIGVQRRQKRRTAFVEAAMKLIAREQNLYAITPDALVREAGASRGTFYNYFDSPRDVLDAVAFQITDDINQSILTDYQEEKNGAVRLVYSLIQFFRRAELDPVWGSTLTRLILEAQAFSRDSLSYFEQNLKLGRQQGLFKLSDHTVALNIVAGAMAFSMNAILTTSLSNDQQRETLEGILRALGSTNSQAKKSVEQAFLLSGAKIGV